MAEKTQYFECKKCGKTCSIKYYSFRTLLGFWLPQWRQSFSQNNDRELKETWFGNYIQCLPGGKKNTISKEDYDKYIRHWGYTKTKLLNEMWSKHKSFLESLPFYEEELKKLEQKRKEVQEIYKNRPLCRVKEIKD